MGLRTFLNYLLGKQSELQELKLKDVVMAKAILDIHRKRTHKSVVKVPLFSLVPIHVLDRENAIIATEQRAAILREHREEILGLGELTCTSLAKFLPSVSWIKVVEETPKQNLSFEGNGRIAALQTVFAPADGLEIEVERYEFRNKSKILRRLNRVRRMNGLLP